MCQPLGPTFKSVHALFWLRTGSWDEWVAIKDGLQRKYPGWPEQSWVLPLLLAGTNALYLDVRQRDDERPTDEDVARAKVLIGDIEQIPEQTRLAVMRIMTVFLERRFANVPEIAAKLAPFADPAEESP